MDKNTTDIKKLHICDQQHNYWWEHIYHPYYPKSPHNSKHLLDIYTLTHIFWPMLTVYLSKKIFKKNVWITIFIYILVVYFEIYENKMEQIVKYRRIEIDTDGYTSYRGDSTLNLVGDILANIMGIYLAYNIESDIYSILIMLILFILVTKTVGYTYWTSFIKFAFDLV